MSQRLQVKCHENQFKCSDSNMDPSLPTFCGAKMCQGSQASLSLRPVEVIYDLGSPWVLLLLKSACCISSSDCVGQENKSQNCIVTCGNHTSYKLQTHNCVMLYYQHLSTIQVIRLYLDAEFTYLLQNEIQ